MDHIILGAGLAGLSAGYHLGGECLVLEKTSRVGGVATSVARDGFTFDHAPHILFTANRYAANLILGLLGDNVHIQDREAWIYHHRFGKTYTRFPFQAHLNGLPAELVRDCLVGIIEAHAERDPAPPKNYAEWIVRKFGAGIANHLMFPYSEKLWTVPPDRLNYEWIDRRVPVVSIREVVDGALLDKSRRVGFNNKFWYPLRGGIEPLAQAFWPKAGTVRLNTPAVRIRLGERKVELKGGETLAYRKLITTLTPMQFVALADEVSPEVARAAEGLLHNSILCVNLGVDRPTISAMHWCYYYEPEFSFHRLSFPMNFSPHAAPAGMSSISTETAYSKFRSIDKATVIDRTIAELKVAGILRAEDRIVVRDVLDIPVAYILYDHDHRRNIKVIHDWQRANDVIPAGRFGEWEYFNMDHSILSGQRAAAEVRGVAS